MIDNCDLWRLRALEFRALAAGIEGEDAQQTMLRIADHYARLAAKANQRSSDALAPPPIEPAPPHALPWVVAEAL